MVLIDIDSLLDDAQKGDFPDLLAEPSQQIKRESMPRMEALSDTEDSSEDDAMLDELLGERPQSSGATYPTKKGINGEDTSETESDRTNEELFRGGEDSNEASDPFDEDEDWEENEEEDSTDDLLSRAQDRLSNQGLREEISRLKEIVAKKNNEIEILAGHLRRAVETKCDLLQGFTEMELFHEHNIMQKDVEKKELQKESFTQQELRAEIEKEFMNEIVLLTKALDESKTTHEKELNDRERLYQTELLDKEYEIVQLAEEIRRLQSGGGAPKPKKKGLASMFSK